MIGVPNGGRKGNELPRLSDVSGALAGRMIILRLSESWYGREDPGLFMRLGPELPGILLWAIEGWRRLRARGHFVVPESSQEVQQELNDLTSPVGAFIRQCCDLGAEQSVARDALYVAYQAWCRSEGMVYVSNRGVFGRDLRTAVATLRDVQQHRGPRLYMGIALANHVPFAGLRPRIIWAFSLGQSLAHASSGPQVKPCSGAAVAGAGGWDSGGMRRWPLEKALGMRLLLFAGGECMETQHFLRSVPRRGESPCLRKPNRDSHFGHFRSIVPHSAHGMLIRRRWGSASDPDSDGWMES